MYNLTYEYYCGTISKKGVAKKQKNVSKFGQFLYTEGVKCIAKQFQLYMSHLSRRTWLDAITIATSEELEKSNVKRIKSCIYES